MLTIKFKNAVAPIIIITAGVQVALKNQHIIFKMVWFVLFCNYGLCWRRTLEMVHPGPFSNLKTMPNIFFQES